jgi:hypothetical protein
MCVYIYIIYVCMYIYYILDCESSTWWVTSVHKQLCCSAVVSFVEYTHLNNDHKLPCTINQRESYISLRQFYSSRKVWSESGFVYIWRIYMCMSCTWSNNTTTRKREESQEWQAMCYYFVYITYYLIKVAASLFNTPLEDWLWIVIN